MKTFPLALLGACLLAAACAAQDDDGLKPGDALPSWLALPGVDGKKYAPADFKDRDVLVVVFACCSCPAVEDYEPRLLAFAKRHAGPTGKVGVVAVNVNTIPEDRMPRMKERAEAKSYPFPYLYDETQKIARDFGAEYTPEFFVFDKARKLVYRGALDDRDNPALAKKQFLEEAVEAALSGKTPATQRTLGRGCRVRYHRVKS